jgi:hypothetical protein
MSSQRLRAFTAQLELAKKNIVGEARRRALAELAREAKAEAEQINRAALGRDVESKTFVDGREGAPLESVKPYGTIVHLFAVHVAAVDFAYETILSLSPIYTGRYKDSHILMVNGVETAGPVTPGVDDEIALVNTQPYARRLEHGWSKRQAPDGIYEVAFPIVRRRFGGIVRVDFTYMDLVGHHGRAPALIFRPKGSRRR